MWDAVLARFEKQAPASVMAHLTLERAMPAAWVDEVFETNRQRQYPQEPLFSTVVELAWSRRLANSFPRAGRLSPTTWRLQVRSRYEGMLIALPVERWPAWADDSTNTRAQRLLELA
jgi:hypothetical protein